jgi:hypothetical protein
MSKKAAATAAIPVNKLTPEETEAQGFPVRQSRRRAVDEV